MADLGAVERALRSRERACAGGRALPSGERAGPSGERAGQRRRPGPAGAAQQGGEVGAGVVAGAEYGEGHSPPFWM